MHRRRILTLLLVICMVAAVFSGCGKGGKTEETTAATTTKAPASTTSAPQTTTTETTQVKLNGYEFILAPEDVGIWQGAGETAIHEAVKGFVLEVEELLDCKITIIATDRTTENLLSSVMSGTKLCDFINVRQSTWIPIAVMGGLRPLETPEMLNAGLELYNEDCFNQEYTLMTELNDHIWGLDLTGKYLMEMSFGHLYAFNKRLVTEAGYTPDELYQAVRDGRWTYDLFLEIARKISKDTDGDGVNDIWGVALDCDGNEIWSNGSGPIIRDASGRWVANLNDPRVIKAMEFMNNISGDPQVQHPLEGEAVPNRSARRAIFYEGKAGFAGLTGSNFGDGGTFTMVDEYGILPIPKGPDAQTYMLNMVDVDVYVAPISNPGWENAAKIMTELGRRLYDKEEYREYIEFLMQGDQQSVEVMFEYLLPNAKANIAKCSDDMYQVTRFELYDKVYKGNLTPAAAAEAYQDVIQAELDKVFRQE